MNYREASKLAEGTKLLTSRGVVVFTTASNNVNHFETDSGAQYKYEVHETFMEVKAVKMKKSPAANIVKAVKKAKVKVKVPTKVKAKVKAKVKTKSKKK